MECIFSLKYLKKTFAFLAIDIDNLARHIISLKTKKER